MKVLLAPLNWGLGHASRCVPLVRRLLDEGNEVVLGGDGDSLLLLRKHFPQLRYVQLAPLQLRYSAGRSQVWAMIYALPKLVLWSVKDHIVLRALLRGEYFDQIISDNRFGLFVNRRSSISPSKPTCIYITHQLLIRLPKQWRWLEPLAARMHAHIYTHYDEVWVPDYANKEQSLAGELSHPNPIPDSRIPIKYIGPLSRFTSLLEDKDGERFPVVAVLSGLEPHRTLLETQIVERYLGREDRVLIVQGLLGKPGLRVTYKNVTLVPHMDDAELAQAMCGTEHIIARSGYSSIMDLAALGLLPSPISNPQSSIELIPTPGQPEQEYLAQWIASRSKNK